MNPGWKEFWNTENSIDVSDKHTRAHYEQLAHGMLELIPPMRPHTLLDWGCGDALSTPAFAQAGITVLLHDPVPRFTERLRKRFGATPGVRVLDSEEAARIPRASIDTILVYSVIQYLAKEEFERLLSRFYELLAPGGALILGDVIPERHPLLTDVGDLLRTALRHGFFFEALTGLAATFFSRYRKVRKESGFSTYSETEMLSLLARHSFKAERLPRNLGLSTHRMLFRARRSS